MKKNKKERRLNRHTHTYTCTHMLYNCMLSALVAGWWELGLGPVWGVKHLWANSPLCWFSLSSVFAEGGLVGRLGWASGHPSLPASSVRGWSEREARPTSLFVEFQIWKGCGAWWLLANMSHLRVPWKLSVCLCASYSTFELL